MYFKNELVEKVNILPSELKSTSGQINEYIDNIILTKLKDKLGDKCLKYGLIKRESIVQLSRSVPYFNNGRFNSSMSVKVRFSADICNPSENQIIECKVSSQNKMGILAYVGNSFSESPLVILLARQHHLENDNYKNIKNNDTIKVKIIGKKFDINDKQISIIAKLDDSNDIISVKKKIKNKKNNNTNNENKDLDIDENYNKSDDIKENNDYDEEENDEEESDDDDDEYDNDNEYDDDDDYEEYEDENKDEEDENKDEEDDNNDDDNSDEESEDDGNKKM